MDATIMSLSHDVKNLESCEKNRCSGCVIDVCLDV